MYFQQHHWFQTMLIDITKFSLMAISQNEEKELSLLQQLAKNKMRLTQTLKAFEDFKKKTTQTLHFDVAARKIQRFWRRRKQARLEREWNRVTHRYIKERLDARLAQWQLEENQAVLGKALVKDSLKHTNFMMEGLVRHFLRPSNTETKYQTTASSLSNIKSALASKISSYNQGSGVQSTHTTPSTLSTPTLHTQVGTPTQISRRSD